MIGCDVLSDWEDALRFHFKRVVHIYIYIHTHTGIYVYTNWFCIQYPPRSSHPTCIPFYPQRPNNWETFHQKTQVMQDEWKSEQSNSQPAMWRWRNRWNFRPWEDSDWKPWKSDQLCLKRSIIFHHLHSLKVSRCQFSGFCVVWVGFSILSNLWLKAERLFWGQTAWGKVWDLV